LGKRASVEWKKRQKKNGGKPAMEKRSHHPIKNGKRFWGGGREWGGVGGGDVFSPTRKEIAFEAWKKMEKKLCWPLQKAHSARTITLIEKGGKRKECSAAEDGRPGGKTGVE